MTSSSLTVDLPVRREFKSVQADYGMVHYRVWVVVQADADRIKAKIVEYALAPRPPSMGWRPGNRDWASPVGDESGLHDAILCYEDTFPTEEDAARSHCARLSGLVHRSVEALAEHNARFGASVLRHNPKAVQIDGEKGAAPFAQYTPSEIPKTGAVYLKVWVLCYAAEDRLVAAAVEYKLAPVAWYVGFRTGSFVYGQPLNAEGTTAIPRIVHYEESYPTKREALEAHRQALTRRYVALAEGLAKVEADLAACTAEEEKKSCAC